MEPCGVTRRIGKGSAPAFFLLFCASVFIVVSGAGNALSEQVEGFLLSLVGVGLSFLLAAVAGLVLLGLAACSRILRAVIRTLADFFSPFPALVLVNLLLFMPVTPFWGACFVGAFSLVWRGVHAVLESEKIIPHPYLRTARALRLTKWTCFWRVHMAVALPPLFRACANDMPDFWLRFLGTGMVLSLCPLLIPLSPSATSTMLAWMDYTLSPVAVIPGSILLIALVNYGLFRPARHKVRHYEAPFSSLQEQAFHQHGETHFWRTGVFFCILCVVLGLILFMTFYMEGGQRIFCDTIIAVVSVFPVLLATDALWWCIGSLFSGRSHDWNDRKWRIIRHVLGAVALFPLFFLYPFVGWDIAPILLLFLSVQPLFGYCFTTRLASPGHTRFMATATRLRLTGLTRWRRLSMPLMSLALGESSVSIMAFLWNQAFLLGMLLIVHNAESFGLGASSMTALLYADPSYAMILFCLTTILTVGLTCCGLIPLQRRLARKYGAHS